MGFVGDLFKQMASAAWEAGKQHAQTAIEDGLEHAGHKVKRRFAAIPDDVQVALDTVPEGEPPEIQYRDDYGNDTTVFLDRRLTDEDHERGWAPGHVRDREVRVRVPSKDEWFRQLERKLTRGDY